MLSSQFCENLYLMSQAQKSILPGSLDQVPPLDPTASYISFSKATSMLYRS